MTFRTAFVCIVLAALTDSALAAAGVSTANLTTLLDTVLWNVRNLGRIIASIAAIWAGYKVLWGGETLEAVAPLLIGGALVACAGWIATLLVTGSI